MTEPRQFELACLALGSAQLAVVVRFLLHAQRRIFLLGRSGRWEYINMDGVSLRVDEFLASRFEALTRKGGGA